MNKEGLIKLTTDLYYLTSLFPKKEPLRYKIREVASEILNSSISASGQNVKKIDGLIYETKTNLDILDSFFDVAKSQNWVSPVEILNLQEEYSKLEEDLKNLSETRSQEEIIFVPPTTKNTLKPAFSRQISSRQEKIIAILKEKERLQVRDLKEIFSDISKRTLRRDFEHLLKEGLVVRIGDKNNTFYQSA